MNELATRYEITKGDVRKDKLLKAGAWSAPLVLPVVPAAALFLIALIFGSTPATIAPFVFFGLIWLVIGFILGLGVSGGLLVYRSRWLSGIRERIAVDGVMAHEVEWFTHELKPSEKRALKDIGGKDLLLADAYRETLASRLTATRILKSTRKELLLAKRRRNKLKVLNSENSAALHDELGRDVEKLTGIEKEAREMLGESETRLEMIEAASRRGVNFVDTEIAMKRLSARAAELPLALESARMEDDIRRELEKELEER
jgi:hypothetical protein